MHLLYISNQHSVPPAIAKALQEKGMTCEHKALSTNADYVAASKAAIIIDYSLSRTHEFSVVSEIRDSGYCAPIVIVIDRDSADLRLAAYDAGVDAVLVQSNAPALLPATIVAAQRRLKSKTATTLQCGNVRLNPTAGTVDVNGQVVEITPCEFSIVQALMSVQGAVVSRELLSARLADHSREAEGTALRVFICRVRRKLAQRGADDIIRTVWGTGYRVEAPARAGEAVKPQLGRRSGARPAHAVGAAA